MGVWLTEKGVHSTHIHRHAVTLYWKQKRAFSPLKKKEMYFSVWVLQLGSIMEEEEGLHFTDGRADVGHELSRVFFFFF